MAEKRANILNRELSFNKRFSDKLKEAFYKEFHSLLNSGVDMQRTLDLLIEEQDKKFVKEIIEGLHENIISGLTLGEAMERSGKFSPYEYQSIRIGEETGRLKEVMEQLSAYFNSKVRLKRQLVSVFTYPSFVILITFGVLYFMLNNVVPMFEDVFKQFGQELPPLTKTIISISENFSTYMMIFGLFLVGIGIVIYTQRKTDAYRRITATISLRLPVFGPLMRKIYLARTCQSISLLLSSFTPLVQTLKMVEEMIGFYPLEVAMKDIRADVIKGGSLHKGFQRHSIFDKKMVSLTKIAEETNQLHETFDRLAKQYQEDVEYRTKLLGTIIEPAIIVVIGGLVGLIMVAMYLPMFNLSNVIQ